MSKVCAALLSVLIVAAGAAFGEGTRSWRQSTFDDFEKGTAKGVAIRSDGNLELAPAFKNIYTTPSTYIWAIAADDAGNIYAAAGSPARLYRVTPDGQASIIFEPQELQIQALVVAGDGVIYAATSPDGKVYRLEHRPVSLPAPAKGGEKPGAAQEAPKAAPAQDKAKPPVDSSYVASVFFDPDTKYIWDLALDQGGDLYAATGDHGQIFRVKKSGEHSLFFKSDEAHIRVLAIDPKGNLIAGSDGSGLVYRISPAGEAFVLFSAAKKEITALAIDAAGNIYAAGAGEKRAQQAGAFLPAAPLAIPPTAGGAQPQPVQVIVGAAGGPAIGGFPFPGAGASGGSEVYRIAPDGSPQRIWSSREDLVYALAFDQRGHLLAGTGNKGRIFAIAGEDEFTDLLKASATQVTAFAPAPHGGLYASTSNLGKLFVLGPAPESEGSYESDVFDARIFSRWGRAEVRSTGGVAFFARSGNVDNPDRNWSPWKKVDLEREPEVSVPPARFIQWKAVLKAGGPAPRLDEVLLNYRPKNVAPDIEDVTVQVGVRFQSLPKPAADNLGGGGGGSPPGNRFEAPPPAQRDRDSIGVRWSAHDDNDDQLVYSLHYRGDGDSRWLLLKDDITDKYFSFDASLLPDGGYNIKVVASDAPSHSPEDTLRAEKESSRFEVDTTPPRVEGLSASVEGARLHISFRAIDSFSPIKRAEYSVDAGDWQFTEPVGLLSDARVENYDFRIALPQAGGEGVLAKAQSDPPSPASQAAKSKLKPEAQPAAPQQEHVVVVRVYDRFENMGSAKTVLRPARH